MEVPCRTVPGVSAARPARFELFEELEGFVAVEGRRAVGRIDAGLGVCGQARAQLDRTETGLPPQPALLLVLCEPPRIIAQAIGPG
jgi:hypothetical protein